MATSQQHTVVNLRGEKITGTVKIRLRPGFGVQVDNKHLEDGPHDVPVAIAQQLIDSNRADAVVPGDDSVEQPENREPVVENRDPRVNRRR